MAFKTYIWFYVVQRQHITWHWWIMLFWNLVWMLQKSGCSDAHLSVKGCISLHKTQIMLRNSVSTVHNIFKPQNSSQNPRNVWMQGSRPKNRKWMSVIRLDYSGDHCTGSGAIRYTSTKQNLRNGTFLQRKGTFYKTRHILAVVIVSLLTNCSNTCRLLTYPKQTLLQICLAHF